ncbi:Integrase [Bradyrhizobium erythrophlei]|nr:Integrase [Bradyrhizobium erythrophlei]
MPRPTNRLSALTLKKKLPPGLYADGGGLYMQVSLQGTKAWIFRYARAKRPRKMGLGPVSTKPDDKRITLADARQKAAAARSLLIDGVDPIEARNAKRAQAALEDAHAVTFKHCADEYLKDNEASWKNEVHRRQWASTLKTYVHPVIGHLPVAGVDTGLVLKILRPIWNAKPETANRVRGRIETILDWAKTHTYRQGDNPARWKGHLDNVLPKRSKVKRVRHHPALPYVDVPEFVAELRDIEGITARALEFTILTAGRTGAVIGATLPEIDLEAKVWTVPPERAGTKIDGDEPRRVPLSARAIEILKALPRQEGNPHVFIGAKSGKALSNMAMLEMMREMRPGFVPHGFRSTFKDWCSETTNYPNEVSEAALWHVVADKVEAAYRRGDLFEKRCALMADWAAFCCKEMAK